MSHGVAGAAATADATWRDHAFVALQRLLPTRAISASLFGVTHSGRPWLRRALINAALKRFDIRLEEAAQEDPEAYASFADFFARALKPGLRPLPASKTALACPVDGAISQCGSLTGGDRLIQAKGSSYRAAELLADAELAKEFADGSFATIYLAPKDYHRIHMPIAGRLRQWTYIPGRLFSVNPATARALPGVFARNERVSAIFDTSFGPLALVMVGAMCVGSIETVWSGRVTPPHRRQLAPQLHRPTGNISLARGAEAGRFNFGSTVILLLSAGAARWHAGCIPETVVRMGEALADLNLPRS